MPPQTPRPPKAELNRRGLVSRLLDTRQDPRWGRDPDCIDADTINMAMRALGKVFGPNRYFQLSATGWDNLPKRPVMLVANHSGGTSIPDAWGLGFLWYSQFGMTRPIHPLAHDMVFALKSTAQFFSKLGALRASRDMGMRLLTEFQRDMLVMPGGDIETWRPYKDRYKVRWAGRSGYARLALKAGVPIVPIASAGAHSTLRVLTDGRRFARRIGLRRLARAEVFPIHLSLPWVLGIGPLPHIPTPGHFRFRIGKPIFPPMASWDSENPPKELVLEHDAKVRAAMQGELDVLRDEERYEPPSTVKGLLEMARSAAQALTH